MAGCKINQNSERARAATVILNNLVAQSYELNVIFFGEGLDHHEAEGDNEYALVKSSEKYQTKKELEEKTREIFSSDYSDQIMEIAFQGFAGAVDNTASFSRYIETAEGLTIRTSYEPITVAEYDFSTTEITKISKKFIQGKIMTTNFEKNEYVEITLINENGEWRIDSATY